MLRVCLLPSILLPVVISSCLVCVADLFPLSRFYKRPCLPCLLGEPVVKVRDDAERCAFRVTEADVYPIVPVERRKRFGDIIVRSSVSCWPCLCTLGGRRELFFIASCKLIKRKMIFYLMTFWKNAENLKWNKKKNAWSATCNLRGIWTFLRGAYFII